MTINMIYIQRATTLVTVLLLTLCASCRSTQPLPPPWGAQMDAMTDRATTRLLAKERATRGEGAPLFEVQVAVLPPVFSGSVEGGANESELHASIARAVGNSGMFVPVSRHLVRNAVNAAGVSDAQGLLGIAAARERFLTELADGGFIPEYLVFPELTTSEETYKGRVVRRKTVLNLQLARSNDGVVAHEQFDSMIQASDGHAKE